MPRTPDTVPLWGWYRWLSEAKPRPDLRAIRRYCHPGPYVLIQCGLLEEAVVLSDFDAWHVILNNGYVSLSGEDDETYESELSQCRAHADEQARQALRDKFYKSWERVIEMDPLREPYWFPTREKPIQACFWQLERHQVRSAKHFYSVDSSKF